MWFPIVHLIFSDKFPYQRMWSTAAIDVRYLPNNQTLKLFNKIIDDSQ